jgi:hypothetical protein
MLRLLLLPLSLLLLATPTASAQPPAAAAAPPPAVAPQYDLPALLRTLARNTPDSERLLEERISAFTMTSLSEELDKKGRVKHAKLRVTRVREQNGQRVALLLKATDDGKDVTEKKRKELDDKARDEDRKKNEKGLSFPVPFTAESQPLHHFQLVGPDPRDPSLVRIRFWPAGRKGEDVMIGEARVDPAAGVVRSLSFRPSKYPSSLVDRLDIDMTFRTVPEVGAVVERIRGEGNGGLLFVRKYRRTTVTFTDVTFKPERESQRMP